MKRMLGAFDEVELEISVAQLFCAQSLNRKISIAFHADQTRYPTSSNARIASLRTVSCSMRS